MVSPWVELPIEILALRSAMHSVGRLRKESRRRSLTGLTVATPTSLQFPSPSSRSPLPLRMDPADSSDVSVASTTKGGALYRLPIENQNLDLNSSSTLPLAPLIVPWKSSGAISIFRNGGNGNPRNLVVAPVRAGMYRLSTSKETDNSSLFAASSMPVAVPLPPSALYSKSGYLEMPSLHACRVWNLMLYCVLE